jgi:putative Mn2+ efflux pump MntP
VVGIGFGLNYTISQTLLTIFVIGIVTFMVSMVGWFLGNRDIPVPEKTANVLAGIALIGLGTYTLIEHTLL